MGEVTTYLRRMWAVSGTGGSNRGRTCDVFFAFAEAQVFGIVVPGKRFRILKNNDLFIPLKHIVRIGTDVVLVDLRNTQKPDRPGGKKPPYCCGEEQGAPGRRSFEEYE